MDYSNKNRLAFFDIVILVLSIYVLFALLIDSFFSLSDELSNLLNYIDTIICIIFLYDFFSRLIKAPSKLDYLKWGWLDLVSSIPTLDYLRYGRLIRLIRIIRILRVYRSMKYLAQHLFKNRAKGTFASVAIIAFMMIVFGSISILQFEQTAGGNIKTAEDAIWWSFVTITTVGYGDMFPITTEGRLVAAVLMIAGVGLFGTFTGFVASYFLNDKKEKIEIE